MLPKFLTAVFRLKPKHEYFGIGKQHYTFDEMLYTKISWAGTLVKQIHDPQCRCPAQTHTHAQDVSNDKYLQKTLHKNAPKPHTGSLSGFLSGIISLSFVILTYSTFSY